MCGLVGMAGYLDHKHKQAMKDLLFLDTLRGKDSTGLTTVNRTKGVLTRKMAVPGYEFIEHPVVEKAMGFADQLWIGHNRFKTTGAISRENAHPFEVLDDEGDVLLVGAHNGTLDNKWEIERLLDEKFDTDSEALFNLLVDQPTFKDAVNKLKGAWSLVWWDPTTDTINFCRNDKRPMTYCFTKDRKVMIWASEAWMLNVVCGRHGIEQDTNNRGLACYSTSENFLYSLTIPQQRDQRLPELRKEGGYTGAPAGNFQGYRGYNHGWWEEIESHEEREKKASERKKETEAAFPPKSNVVDIGFARGFEGEEITMGFMKDVKKKGCAWCKDPVMDVGVAWIASDAVVCIPCMNDSHPKDGDRVRQDDLDDDLPFDTDDGPRYGDPAFSQENSDEHRQLINAALGSAKATIG